MTYEQLLEKIKVDMKLYYEVHFGQDSRATDDFIQKLCVRILFLEDNIDVTNGYSTIIADCDMKAREMVKREGGFYTYDFSNNDFKFCQGDWEEYEIPYDISIVGFDPDNSSVTWLHQWGVGGLCGEGYVRHFDFKEHTQTRQDLWFS